MWTARRVLGLFVAGGIGGIVCDQIHVQGGVLSYPHVVFLDQDWWVGPNFGIGVLLILAGSVPFARWAARLRPTSPTGSDLVTGSLWFLSAYVASAVFSSTPRALLFAYLLVFGARIALLSDRKALAAHGVMLAVGGVAWEATLCALGLFHYNHPHIFGVAWWLPGLYLHGAPLALAITRRLQPVT